MRIIVRYCQVFGNYSTKAIDLDPLDRLPDIQRKISNKFQIPLSKQLIKIKMMGMAVRLTDDYSLALYDVHERCTLYVELVQSQQELQQKQQKQRNINLFNKLGLKTIQEEDDPRGDLYALSQTDLPSPNRPLSTDYTLESDMVLKEDSLQEKTQQRKRVETLLDLTKKGDLPGVKAFLKTEPEMVNQMGNSGWNSFHFAIFCNHVELV